MTVTGIAILTSCNKDPEQFLEPDPVPPSGTTIAAQLEANANDSLYRRLVIHSGLMPLLSGGNNNTYTVFAADNNAMKVVISALSGGLVPINAPDAVFSGFISANIPQQQAAAIVAHTIIPQSATMAVIGTGFPNYQYPTLFNPAPTISSLVRLDLFPSARNGNWVNNVPLVGVDQAASNGIIHHTAVLITPPQRYLWNRIDTDPQLTYLKAAILRADSASVTPTAPGTLQGFLLNIGANFTVFAPTDAAFQAILTGAITQALIGMGVPPGDAATQAAALASTPAVFQNPMLYSVLTSRVVGGIVSYHLLGVRAFTNNFPTTPTKYPTLLNLNLPTHEGVELDVTMGAPFPTAATVKGKENPAPANIQINASPMLPDPFGSSDQIYLNGVLHKIDQVLLPAPLAP